MQITINLIGSNNNHRNIIRNVKGNGRKKDFLQVSVTLSNICNRISSRSSVKQFFSPDLYFFDMKTSLKAEGEDIN